MSTPRTYVLVDSPEHGETVDSLIAARLRDEEGTHCNRWSGVYTDGERFGVLWGSPATDIFGHPPSAENPDGDPALVLVEESAPGEWSEVLPEPEEAPL